MPLSMTEIAPDALTQELLFANGRSDASIGKSKHDGWAEICKEFGWDPYNRTPAREKYEDGYYSIGIRNKA